MSKRSPEYQSLRTHMHGICSSLSSEFHTIIPLTQNLCGGRIISSDTRNAIVSTKGTPAYELASQLLTSVQVSVQFDPEKLYFFAEKLSEHGHDEIAMKLQKECESKGGRKAPTTTTTGTAVPTQHLEEEGQDETEVLQQEPTLRLFTKHITQKLENHWIDIGVMLGIDSWRIKAIDQTKKSKSDAMMDVFDLWKKSDVVKFTWSQLFKELSSLKKIDKTFLAEIKKDIVKELTQS